MATWTVWVGGIDDHYDNEQEAMFAYHEWCAKGYDDVCIERTDEVNK